MQKAIVAEIYKRIEWLGFLLAVEQYCRERGWQMEYDHENVDTGFLVFSNF